MRYSLNPEQLNQMLRERVAYQELQVELQGLLNGVCMESASKLRDMKRSYFDMALRFAGFTDSLDPQLKNKSFKIDEEQGFVEVMDAPDSDQAKE